MAAPSNTPVVVLPSPSSLSLASRQTSLFPGQQFVARVAALDGQFAFLRVGSGLVAARADQPLTVGARLQLQVAEVSEQRVVLKIIGSVPEPPETKAPAPAPTAGEQPPAPLTRAALAKLPLNDLLEAAGSDASALLDQARALATRSQAQARPQLTATVLAPSSAGGRQPVALANGRVVSVAIDSPLAAGQELDAQLVAVEGKNAVLRLAPRPGDKPLVVDDQLALMNEVVGALKQQVGDKTAANIGSYLVARGIPTSDSAVLAARVLAEEVSPVQVIRDAINGQTKPQLQAMVAAIEQDLVSGDGNRVKKALSRIGIDQEKKLLKGEISSASTVKANAGPTAERAVGAQQVLLMKPSADAIVPIFLYLPLPDGGEAKMLIEEGQSASSGEDVVQIRGELSMSQIGTIGFHLASSGAGLFLLIEAPSPSASAQLRASLSDLSRALEQSLGKPVVATVVERDSSTGARAPLLSFEGADQYV